MVIRDDREKRKVYEGAVTRTLPPDFAHRDVYGFGGYAALYDPDFVLYDCPECGRSHFVTVDACPDEATAALETARVDGWRAA